MGRWLFCLVGMMLCWLLPTGLSAQSGWTDPTYVCSGRPFLESRNPAGLSWLDGAGYAEVRLGAGRSKGGLVNYYESDDASGLELSARSLYRFSRNMVMRGALSYENTRGRDMSGSVFIDPRRYVFDLTEQDDSHQGEKRLERYRVLTEMSYDPLSWLSLGASFDFTCANYSKMKDLRHANDFSDLAFRLAGAFHLTDCLALGAAWELEKSVEGVAFERFSPGDLHYEMLVSYGSFWGKRKTFEETSAQISKSRNPVLQMDQGFSIQLDWQPAPGCSLFAEGFCLWRDCQYGHPSPNSILYNTFEGHTSGGSLTGVVQTGRIRHRLELSFRDCPVTSYESIYKRVHHSSGETEIIYYDPKEVAGHRSWEAGLNYRTDGPVRDRLPAWTLGAEIRIEGREQLATLYPFYRKQEMVPFSVGLGGWWNLLLREDHLLRAGLETRFSTALRDELEDGSFLPDASQIPPQSAPQMLGREREYLGAPKWSAAPSIRYGRRLPECRAFIQAGCIFRRAMGKLEYLQSPSWLALRLEIGLEF